jgi:hypothetical protein
MRQLTEEDIQKIAKELGIEPTPGFSEKIVDIADNHFIQKKYWKNREQNADARADLKKISNQAKKLINSLEKLGPLGQNTLTYGNMNLEHTIEFIRQFQNYVEKGIEYIPFEKAGPSQNAPLILTIENLGIVYHAIKGKMPGISSHWQDYTLGGPFLRFVIAFLRIVEPEMVENENDFQRIGELSKRNLDAIKSLIESPQKDN